MLRDMTVRACFRRRGPGASQLVYFGLWSPNDAARQTLGGTAPAYDFTGPRRPIDRRIVTTSTGRSSLSRRHAGDRPASCLART